MHSAIKERPEGFFDITLPQIFPTMSAPDRSKILQWYVEEGEIVRPGKRLLEVATAYGDIDILMPPFLKGNYRIQRIVKRQHDMVALGDLFVTLQRVESTASRRERVERKTA